MLNLIKKDIIVSLSNKSILLMLLIYVPFIILAFGTESISKIFLFSTFGFCHMIITTPFSYEIEDKPHIFIQSLPVKKTDIVISKYINIIISFILGTIYSLVYIWIMNIIGILDSSKIDIITLVFAFGLTIVVSSVSLPTQFKFSPKIAKFINTLLFLMFFVNITTINYVSRNFTRLDFSNFNNLLIVSAIISVIYFISMGISITLYTTRKFY
ncbi:ABC-2 transporter permease [Senegalia massiliensis]|uniref:ABC-2 transporter permease n=1 Tax=Senegalia massiliensis TaxID=1720316 RepID=A0A845QXR3_9CLOT|nr:ABC-2 transporter permease [Senegalia massiliensis]NBI07265.1 ABC-2 transporter permease [Senegalia massiliensis]